MYSESLLEDRKKPKIAGCQGGTVGVVVQNMNPLLTQEARGDLGFVGGSIVVEEQGPRGTNGWALIAHFLDNFGKHHFGVVCGCDCSLLRQYVDRLSSLCVKKNGGKVASDSENLVSE